METSFLSTKENDIFSCVRVFDVENLIFAQTCLRFFPINKENIDGRLSNDHLENVERFENKCNDDESRECRLLTRRGKHQKYWIVALWKKMLGRFVKIQRIFCFYFEENQPPQWNTRHNDEENCGNDVAPIQNQFPDRLSNEEKQNGEFSSRKTWTILFSYQKIDRLFPRSKKPAKSLKKGEE